MCFVRNEVSGVRLCREGNAGGSRQAVLVRYAPGGTFSPPHIHASLPQVYTVCVGMALGQACMLLAAGTRGKRYMLEHATAMLHQPRVPPTGPRQAIDISLKWREVRGTCGAWANDEC